MTLQQTRKQTVDITMYHGGNVALGGHALVVRVISR